MATNVAVSIDSSRKFSGHPVPPLPLAWENREELLRQRIRWGDWPVMFYRPNLYQHSRRVAALALRDEFFAPVQKRHPEIDRAEVHYHALHHDDHELTDLGDVCYRRKLLMNAEQLTDHEKDEIIAIQEIDHAFAVRGRRRMVGRHPHRYSLHEILTHAVLKDTVVSQYCSIIDKMVEGFSEGVHEVLAGNVVFFESTINYLEVTRRKLVAKYWHFGEMLLDPKGPFSLPVCNLQTYFERCRKTGGRPGCPHTPESVAAKTGILFYDIWKEVTIELFGEEPLLTVQEFYPGER